MKKLYPILLTCGLILAGMAVNAQSQRFILAEEFTQASCGPCASQNPGFNALLNANSTKIIGLKYQVWWPGYDPMYDHNPTDVSPRVSYYGVSGVPSGRMDGATITGGSYSGAPNGLNQAKINAQYAVASPFDIAVTKTFSPDYSQITIDVDITCTQAVSGNLVAQTVIMEQQINFLTAPGSNGEKVFYGVMKKMLPNATGTSLPSSWTAGMTQSLSFTVDVPSYFYDIRELAVVSFIQNNSTKAVLQTGFSAASLILPDLDLSIPIVNGIPNSTCDPISADILIKNEGSTTVTSADIIYQIDNDPAQSAQWTGSLSPGASVSYTVPSFSPTTNGNHDIKFTVANPNNGVDISPINNNLERNFLSLANFTTLPVAEGFVSTTYPPTDWSVNDLNKDGFGWKRTTAAGGFGTSSESSIMQFFNSANGRVDELFLPQIDLSSIAGNIATLSFDMAHIQKALTALGANDRLDISASTDCGASWTQVFQKVGADLSTNPGSVSATAYVPAANEWRNESVDLSQFLGSNEVLIKFYARSNNGNNLYIDNINIDVTTGINENALSSAIKLYPSLTSGMVNMDINLEKNTDLNISVYNLAGQVVYSLDQKNVTSKHIDLDLSNLANGQYNVRIVSNEAAIVKPISVVR